MPKVSVIIPTYNCEKYIAEAIESALNQTYKDFELIIIDQNSDDRLVSILSKYNSEYEIIHLRSESGLSRARNVGLKNISGNIAAFPDDDCQYPPPLLSNVNKWLIENPEYSAISGRSVDLEGNPSVGVFDNIAGEVNKFNIWHRMTSIGFFVRKDSLGNNIWFDVRLGVGADRSASKEM